MKVTEEEQGAGPKKRAPSKKPSDNESEEFSDCSSSSDGEELDEDSDDEEYDLTPYLYLIGTTQYDQDSKAVYKSTKADAQDYGTGAEVIVYRSKFNDGVRWRGLTL